MKEYEKNLIDLQLKEYQEQCKNCFFCDQMARKKTIACCTFPGKPKCDMTGSVCLNHRKEKS